MRRTLLALLIGAAPGATPAEALRSYATVLDVQPVVETWYEPVTRQSCTEPTRADHQPSELADTIGADIRAELGRWRALRSCTTVTEREPRERVTAYRVTYRYRGHTATTRLDHHPGDRLPVNVRLAPLP